MKMTNIERFLSKVEKTNNCWLWTSPLSNNYGQFWTKENGKWKKWFSHRFSYTHYVGSIPEGMVVMHRCDVTACVNPRHLKIGTQSDNLKDMYAKNRNRGIETYRQQSSERNCNAKLTYSIAMNIIDEYKKGNTSYRKLGGKYGVSKKAIQNIIHRKTYVNS